MSIDHPRTHELTTQQPNNITRPESILPQYLRRIALRSQGLKVRYLPRDGGHDTEMVPPCSECVRLRAIDECSDYHETWRTTLGERGRHEEGLARLGG
jgi:hypothetical protein